MGLFSGLAGAAGGLLSGGVSGALGSAVGAIGGYLGQQQTNQMQMGLAQDQMDFQERMSNTAYQRAVADMQAAGLNPMLAYSQGGATSPGGAMATIGNPTAAGANLAATQAQTQNSQATNELIRAQTGKTEAETVQTLSSAGHLDAQRDNIRQEMTAFTDRLNNLRQSTATDQARQYELTGHGELFHRQSNTWNRLTDSQIKLYDAQASKYIKEAELLGLKVPEGLAEFKFWSGPRAESAMNTRHSGTWDRTLTNTIGDTAEMAGRASAAFTSTAKDVWSAYKAQQLNRPQAPFR